MEGGTASDAAANEDGSHPAVQNGGLGPVIALPHEGVHTDSNRH